MEQPNSLLACPFCGSNEVSESSGRNGDNTPFYYVECEKCAGMGPGHNKPRLAVEAWNVRAGAGRAAQESGGKQLCSSEWLAAGDKLATAIEGIRMTLYGLSLDLRQAVIAQRAIDKAKGAVASWREKKAANDGGERRRE